MIQGLLGGARLLGEGRKISLSGTHLEGSPSPSPSSSTTAGATTTTTKSEQQNLRCPRCDSSNTKFCYYNNYNLTQPRHFCKTCRRYWTKGGTLRNVPIGGGCRKNKNTSTSTTSGKVKATLPDIVSGNSNPNPSTEFNPVLWASPHNSQLLSLLRGTQNHNTNLNPNPIPNSFNIKEEGTLIGSYMTSGSAVATSVINARPPISLDPLSQFPIGLCSSLWSNNQHQPQQPFHHHHQQQQQNLLLMGEVQNTGIHDLYQRLRSSTNYNTDHSPTVLSNVITSTSSMNFEPSPAAGGYWNPALSWHNLPTTNGAFP